jgi:O-antigen ligase
MGYTVSRFMTYISRNEEKSTVHNYYLQTMVEQGIPGLVIFMGFLFVILFKGQDAYKRLKSVEDKRFVLAVVLSIIVILVNIFLSDLIEADKIGTLFFMNVALLVNMDLISKRKAGLETDKAAREIP